jgi:hypothetical protein
MGAATWFAIGAVGIRSNNDIALSVSAATLGVLAAGAVVPRDKVATANELSEELQSAPGTTIQFTLSSVL